MSIASLPIASPVEEGLFFTIQEAVRCQGPSGEYLRLTGNNPNDEIDVLTVDARFFDLIEPFIEAWQEGVSDHIPVFLGNNGKWRFSTRSAAPVPTNDSDQRLRVSFPPEIAQQVRAKAARTKVSEHELVRSFVRAAL